MVKLKAPQKKQIKTGTDNCLNLYVMFPSYPALTPTSNQNTPYISGEIVLIR